jgi:transposase
VTTYDKSFKEEAVKLAEEIGTKKATEQLGISYNTLSNWRQKRKKYGPAANVGSGNKRKSASQQEQDVQELKKEISDLKRANEILQEALGFFAASRKR